MDGDACSPSLIIERKMNLGKSVAVFVRGKRAIILEAIQCNQNVIERKTNACDQKGSRDVLDVADEGSLAPMAEETPAPPVS
ncbi:MAG: hypothetical protein WCE40_06650 [Polyangia bacterium]